MDQPASKILKESPTLQLQPLWILLSFLLVICLQVFLFQPLFNASELDIEGQYSLFVAFIFLILLLSAFLVVWLLRKYKYQDKPWVTIVAAYGLPVMATLISYLWLTFTRAPVLAGGLAGSLFRATWQPFLYFWMAMILFFSVWFLFPAAGQPARLEIKHILPAILGGLGCGVVNVFMLSIILNWSTQQAAPISAIDPPVILRLVTILLSLTVAPYALEGFYRHILLSSWQARFGEMRGLWLVAAAFAFLTLQPALWLPALLSGVVFGLLAKKTICWQCDDRSPGCQRCALDRRLAMGILAESG